MKPVKVSDLDLVFGVNISDLLPPMKEIPDDFKRGSNKWNKVVNDWFFSGLKNCEWKPKKDVDPKEAIKHVSVVMKSWEPSHEHKTAGCAYLLSEFFDDVKYSLAK